jgi:predicted phosphodiesterase
MVDRSGRGLILNPGSAHGVTGVPTSYTFATIDLGDLAVRIFDIRLGREVRRDPVFLDEED